MFVTCLITVVFMNSNNTLDAKEDNVYGKVVLENKYSYHVDFTKEAKEKKYLGDYSNVILVKSKCAEEIRQ